MQDGTTASRATRYIYRRVIERHLKPLLGKKRASKLSTDDLRAYRKQRKVELLQKRLKGNPNPTEQERLSWERSAGATINRELARLRSALEYARTQAPPKVLRLPHFPIESELDNIRKVVLQDGDYPALRDAFCDPSVQLLFIVSSHVGIRASELKRIRWEQVDLSRKVISLEKGETKNKAPRSAPIFGDMLHYLDAEKRRHDEFYPQSPWVFSRAGTPVKDFREEWRKATAKAGVPNLHFHDLRRTAQRLMRRAGIDRITRMRIMAHKTDAMDIRYGVVEDDDIVDAGAKLDETFRTVMGDGNSTSNEKRAVGDASVLGKLATLSPEKLKALIALRHSRETTRVCSPKLTHYMRQKQRDDARCAFQAQTVLLAGKSWPYNASP